MNGVEDLIGDRMAKEGCAANQEQECQDAISSDHDLVGKFVAKSFFSIRAEQSKERKEEDDCPKDNEDHGVSKMDVHAKGPIKWQDVVEKGVA